MSDEKMRKTGQMIEKGIRTNAGRSLPPVKNIVKPPKMAPSKNQKKRK